MAGNILGRLKEYAAANPLLILGAVIVLSFALKLAFLAPYPHIPGMDSGYYVWHVNDTLRGNVYLNEPPLALLLIAVLAVLGGGSIFGVKLFIALASSAIAIPAYLIVRRLSGSASVGLLSAFLAAFSASNWWIAAGHVKNLAGILFGLFALYYFMESARELNRKNVALLMISIALMALSHLPSAAYFMAILAPSALLFVSLKLLGKGISDSAFRTSVLLLALSLSGAALALTLMPSLVGENSIGVVGLYAVSGAPFPNLSLFQEYFIFSPLALLGAYALYKKKAVVPTVTLSVALLAAFLLTQPLFVQESWLMRFQMMGFVPMALLVALGIGSLKGLWSGAIGGLACLFVLFSLFQMNYLGIIQPVSAEEYEGFSAFLQSHPGSVIVAHDLPLYYWMRAMGADAVQNETAPGLGKTEYVAIGDNVGLMPGDPRRTLVKRPHVEAGCAYVAAIGRYDICEMRG